MTLSSGEDDGPSSIVRRRVIVSGRVQGVGYRYHCRRTAERLGVGGWVRNKFDGTVEAVIEGDREDVDDLIAWCRAGPRNAVVADVQVDDVQVDDDLFVSDGAFRIVG